MNTKKACAGIADPLKTMAGSEDKKKQGLARDRSYGARIKFMALWKEGRRESSPRRGEVGGTTP